MQSNSEFMGRFYASTAAGRIGAPDDLAGIAAFLAGSASDYITGADIPVEGGLPCGA